jgi:hypothetical protein
MIGQGPPEFPLRTSPRQAVLVDAASLHQDDTSWEKSPNPFADALRQSVYLDLLGSLVGVNGVTISVLSTGPAQSSQLAAITPPGIDLLTPPHDLAEPWGRLTWAIDHHLQRAFTRLVVIAADVPALPTRTVATTLSSLASADAIVGTSTETGVYLLGLRDQRGLAAAEAAGGAHGLDRLSVATFVDSSMEPRIVVRYVERRDRLALDRLDSIREAVAAAPIAAPRTALLLHVNPGSTRPQSELPSVFGGFEPDFARGFDR